MIVYQYGVLAPTQNADIVDEQMWRAHRHRNALVEIERARRSCLREAMRDAEVERFTQALATATADVDRLVTEVKAARQRKRSRAESEEQRAALRTARATRWELVRATKEARARARDSKEIEAACDAINDRARAMRSGARRLCGVFWGTYLLVEEAERASRGAPLYRDGEPNDPVFVRWSGDGHVGVRYPDGLPAEEVFAGTDTTMRIDPIDPAIWHRSSRRGRYAYTTIHLRVGSQGPGRPKPVWASFPIKMHRPFPPGAVIRQAEISRVVRGPRVSSEIGRRAQWVVNITLDVPGKKEQTNAAPKAAAVAINVGWRVVPEGLRVLTWQGTDGASGKVVLPPSLVARMQSVQDLASVRRNAFNVARAALGTYLGANQVPDWLRRETETIALWKSSERLTSLAFLWEKQRFAGDDAAFTAIRAWRYHDTHLAQYELGRRDRVQGHRREIVRVAAAQLARRYAVVIHDDTDLRDFQELPATASPDDVAQNETARQNRVRANVSAARVIVQGTFRREGGTAVKLPARDATRTCHVCDQTEAFDAEHELCHTCSQCGTTWDQDENHVRVLLARWRERPGDDAAPGIARNAEEGNDSTQKRETSLQRGKRILKEKEAAQRAARNAAPSVA